MASSSPSKSFRPMFSRPSKQDQAGSNSVAMPSVISEEIIVAPFKAKSQIKRKKNTSESESDSGDEKDTNIKKQKKQKRRRRKHKKSKKHQHQDTHSDVDDETTGPLTAPSEAIWVEKSPPPEPLSHVIHTSQQTKQSNTTTFTMATTTTTTITTTKKAPRKTPRQPRPRASDFW